jgi:hypothetical protein
MMCGDEECEKLEQRRHLYISLWRGFEGLRERYKSICHGERDFEEKNNNRNTSPKCDTLLILGLERRC